MACALGVEQLCTECRMCRTRGSERENKNAEYETAIMQQFDQEQWQSLDIPWQISIEAYLQSLKNASGFAVATGQRQGGKL